jgi:hypothetical protein
LPGFVIRLVFGAVRSTVTFTTSLEVWPTLSVATAFSARLPCAGIVQEALYGAVVSGPPSDVHEPAAQSRLVFEQVKNSTLATPLAASLEVAPSVFGSAAAAFTNWPSFGAVKATSGSWLSTMMLAIVAEVVALPARSVAIARRS